MRPDLGSIWREVAGEFGEETGQSRKVALYLRHRVSRLSLGEIGKLFGGIGPSAVTRNTRRLLFFLEGDLELNETVQCVKNPHPKGAAFILAPIGGLKPVLMTGGRPQANSRHTRHRTSFRRYRLGLTMQSGLSGLRPFPSGTGVANQHHPTRRVGVSTSN